MPIRSLMHSPWKRNIPVRRTDDLNPFNMLQREMNRIFDNLGDFFPTRSFEGIGGTFPKIDIKEKDKEILVSAELPGMEDKDIDVHISDDVLTIKGEKKQEKEEKNGSYYQLERYYGSFHRDIPLPSEIETDKVDAAFKHGVLKIRLPKKPEAQRKTKKIEIKAS